MRAALGKELNEGCGYTLIVQQIITIITIGYNYKAMKKYLRYFIFLCLYGVIL